ncbi:MAG: hypothetical protein JNM76_04695 [Betaproteobacteria bacterium]|nr:hypothetical protein [Betaproteobacteria bacterium]
MNRERVLDLLRKGLRLIGPAGLALSATLLAVTFMSDDAVERAAQAFVKYRIELEAREQFGKAAQSDTGKAALQLQQRYHIDIATARQAMDDKLPDRIAEVIAAMCRLDCQKKAGVRTSVAAGYQQQIVDSKRRIATLSRFVEDRYLTLVANLTRDVRIFLGSNALLFAFVTFLAWMKPQASIQLTLPGLLLCVSTLASAAMYVFGQNWFFTLLNNDFVGFGYFGYASVLFAFLCDIALNHARISTQIMNAFFQAVGATMHAIPC